ncbi:conserved hypothetical protein [Hyella patelloides LEGE 07179]|uniref:Putative restriction endonuclease domain-containing protein n=1 Tax=Hyella patelloides LEGE 07179 TaxID=945734 RepID=A0A563VM35_9CYAN|nr:Uma2 family endonuclease [Hyella patelloides]VEP12393.1 conserved hypothetical protein [Hyella patelloides LEGE 07179]
MTTLAKWTLQDYHRMIEVGILCDRHVELIEGKIIEMAPEKPLHRFTNHSIAKYLRQLLAGKAEVFEAHPITLSNSEPEPDVAIVSLPEIKYLTRHPNAQDIYWLIEISDSTLNYDLTTKKQLYAKEGIAEYWVINLQKKAIHVFRQPIDNNYNVKSEFIEGKITPLSFSNIEIEVNQILIDS